MLYNLIIKSNFYVALMITCLSAYYQILFVDYFDKNILVFTFFSSWFVYVFASTNSIRFKRNKKKYILFFCFCLVNIFYWLINVKPIPSTLFLLFVLVLVSYFYLYPVFSFRLREIPFLKPFVISFVITAFVVSVNFNQLGFIKNSQFHFFVFFSTYFFLWAISLLFDIKDIKYDLSTNLKTIPNTLGINVTKGIVLLCFLISFVFYVNANSFVQSQDYISFYGTLIFASFLSLTLEKQIKPYFYTIFLETSLAFPLLFKLFFSTLFL